MSKQDRDRVKKERETQDVLNEFVRTCKIDFAKLVKEKEKEQLKERDPQSMYLLAGGYARGLFGIKQDWEKARFWMEEAAKAGSIEATCDLASMYMNGQIKEGDLKENHAKAFQLYRKAARHKVAVAYGNLGECYYQGLGVEQDYDEAMRWYKKAAAHGDEHAT